MFVACPSCTKRLNVPDEAAGQTGQCPWCKSPFRLPALTPPDAPATPVVTVPTIAAFPAPAPTATVPATTSPAAVILAALATLAPLSLEPIAEPTAARGDGTLYPLTADPQDDRDTRRRKAQIWKEAAKTADALHRKRNPAGPSDLAWGLVFLGLMVTYVGLVAAVLKIQTPVPFLLPGIFILLISGIFIGIAGAVAVIVVGFHDNIIEGVLCLPGLPWALAGLFFPYSVSFALRFAIRMSVVFGDDLVSAILTWTLLGVLCIAFPCYMPYYVLKNFEAACRPLYLMLIGILYQITAVLLYLNSVR